MIFDTKLVIIIYLCLNFLLLFLNTNYLLVFCSYTRFHIHPFFQINSTILLRSEEFHGQYVWKMLVYALLTVHRRFKSMTHYATPAIAIHTEYFRRVNNSFIAVSNTDKMHEMQKSVLFTICFSGIKFLLLNLFYLQSSLLGQSLVLKVV